MEVLNINLGCYWYIRFMLDDVWLRQIWAEAPSFSFISNNIRDKKTLSYIISSLKKVFLPMPCTPWSSGAWISKLFPLIHEPYDLHCILLSLSIHFSNGSQLYYFIWTFLTSWSVQELCQPLTMCHRWWLAYFSTTISLILMSLNSWPWLQHTLWD